MFQYYNIFSKINFNIANMQITKSLSLYQILILDLSYFIFYIFTDI